jgi:hypothetical protein
MFCPKSSAERSPMRHGCGAIPLAQEGAVAGLSLKLLTFLLITFQDCIMIPLHRFGGSDLRRFVRLPIGLHVFSFLVLFAFAGAPSMLRAQTVSHPVSEISPTIRHYSYTYILSPTTKKDLEYIVVQASNGDIKTVFNACDVCYPAHKGYSQSGTEVRCNNCGNRFPIDGLGIKNTSGTCNPGYLPHTIEGDQVVIKVSDLIVGAYYFLTRTYTGIDEPVRSAAMELTSREHRRLTVSLPAEGRRTFRIFSMNGELRKVAADASRIVEFDLSSLPSGAYILAMEERGRSAAKTFLLY